MNKLLIIIIISLFVTSSVCSQSIFEIRNFYTNKQLKGQKIYVNHNDIVLDSLGRFSMTSIPDSVYLEFGDRSYNIIFRTINLNDTGFYLLYQFDQYLYMETSMYVEHKSWFGLVKKFTYEGGPIEEINKYDIFINRDKLIIYDRNTKYHYSIVDKYRKFITLQID